MLPVGIIVTATQATELTQTVDGDEETLHVQVVEVKAPLTRVLVE